MTKATWIPSTVAVLVCSICIAVAQQPAAPSKTPNDAQQQSKQQQPLPAAESVDVRYARAQLELAEANLNRVQQSNKRVSGSVPGSVVAEYLHDVQVAKTRLEQATAGHAASQFEVWLQRAEAERETAETTWKKAAAVNKRVPGTFGPLDVERFRLRAEVAKLQLERGQALVDSGREAQMQWQIDMLDKQVQRLKEESRRATTFNNFYPAWLW